MKSQRQDGRRFGLKAKSSDHEIAEVEVTTGPSNRLDRVLVRNRRGEVLEIEFDSEQPEWAAGKWIVSGLDVTTEKPGQELERLRVEIGLSPVQGQDEFVILRRLYFFRQDADGAPLAHRPNEVNPLSLELSNCVVN